MVCEYYTNYIWVLHFWMIETIKIWKIFVALQLKTIFKNIAK